MRETNSLRTSVRTKIGISIFSLVFFLIVLEVILRIVGYIYFTSRPTADEIFKNFERKVGERIILCLGDSYTAAANVAEKDSYPRKLQAMLDSSHAKEKLRVINAGVCEVNSSQVLWDLPRNLKRYKPEIIILLAGIANQFNFIGFDEAKKPSRLVNFIGNLKIYKMLRIIASNVRLRFLKDNRDQNGYFYTAAALGAKRRLVDAINDKYIFEEISEADYNLIEYLIFIGEREKAASLLKKLLLDIDPDSVLFTFYSGEFLIGIYENMYNENGPLGLQETISDFQKKLKNNPDLRNDKLFMAYYLFLQKAEKLYKAEVINKQLRDDLGKIIELCRKNNVKIVLQNYPYLYPMVDTAIKEVAVKHSVSLVDQGSVFSKLLDKQKEEIYFQDGLHCMPLGLSIMTENIYDTLINEGIIKK